MNSRQRVLSALNHREPDRVPVDFSGHRSSGISAIAYGKLRKHLGLPEKPVRVYDLIQQLAVVDDDVLDLFGVDTIELGRAFGLRDEEWTDWVLPDGSPCQIPAWCVPGREGKRWVLRSPSGQVVGQMPDGALYFEQTVYPFYDGPEDIDNLERIGDEGMWSVAAAPPGPVSDQTLRETARAFREKTDRAIVGLFGGNLLETGQGLYRNDQFFIKLLAEPDAAHLFLDKLVEIHLRNLETYLENVGPYIDIIAFGDDLGMQTGPQISPDMYREFFKSRHQQLWQRAKQLADVKVLLHSCGGIYELLPDLIDAGLDAVNPVQISCDGMDVARLKREFGNDITFWGGGCDTHHVLPYGTPKEVRQHVREQVGILNPGGGFVFQQVHNIMANIPPENMVAMFNSIQE